MENEVRLMRPEFYFSGMRCLQAIVGTPPVPSRRIAEARARLRTALRARRFETHLWLEPSRHLDAVESFSYKAALHGELSRVLMECMRKDAAWRVMVLQKDAKLEESHRNVPVRTRTLLFASELRPYSEEERDVFWPSTLSPHEAYLADVAKRQRPAYVLAIISFREPARVLENTLAFLRRQGIPQMRIELWVAPGTASGQTVTEEERYKQALAADWPGVCVRVGMTNSMEQRWHICTQYPELTHIVCMDDDVSDVYCKIAKGCSNATMKPLPPGGLESLIHHAHDLMSKEDAYLWGLNSSMCPVNLVFDRISRKSGLVNSFLYGYRNRYDAALRSINGSAVEDVERSCKMFARDGVILRYMMYSARTTFQAIDSLDPLYSELAERRAAEEQSVQDVFCEFPETLAVVKSERGRLINFRILSSGQEALTGAGLFDEALVSEASEMTVHALEEQSGKACGETIMTARCVSLWEALSRGLRSKNTDRAVKDVPAVLDDILRIASGGKKTLASIGLGPAAPSTEVDMVAAHHRKAANVAKSPAKPPPLSSDIAEGTFQHLHSSVDPVALMSTAAPAGQQLDSFENNQAEMPAPHSIFAAAESTTRPPPPAYEDYAPAVLDDPPQPDKVVLDLRNFHRPKLNQRYDSDVYTPINRRPSFWDQNREIFVYWQDKQQRWAIAKRWDQGKDLLDSVRKGLEAGWAYQRNETTWTEYYQGQWHEVRTPAISCPGDQAAPQASTLAATGNKVPPLPSRQKPAANRTTQQLHASGSFAKCERKTGQEPSQPASEVPKGAPLGTVGIAGQPERAERPGDSSSSHSIPPLRASLLRIWSTPPSSLAAKADAESVRTLHPMP